VEVALELVLGRVRPLEEISQMPKLMVLVVHIMGMKAVEKLQ
jgi:hypothetical protein